MKKLQTNNNAAIVFGEIGEEFEYSHEKFGEPFYQSFLKVRRLSECYDIVPILVSGRLFDVTVPWEGRLVEIEGQYRSYNRHEGNSSHLKLVIFALEFTPFDDYPEVIANRVELDGYICQLPVFRRTPKGREITDLMLAVNRAYCKSDYIPCICWGRTARYVARLPLGSRLQVAGRIQSRIYRKKIAENQVIERMTFEVSINELQYIHEQKTAGRVADYHGDYDGEGLIS